jgi:hypothetical protein
MQQEPELQQQPLALESQLLEKQVGESEPLVLEQREQLAQAQHFQQHHLQ